MDKYEAFKEYMYDPDHAANPSLDLADDMEVFEELFEAGHYNTQIGECAQ